MKNYQSIAIKYLPLVRNLAYKMSRGNLSLQDELICVGSEALCIAAMRFDDSKDISFGTYAYPCVRGTMLNAISTEADTEYIDESDDDDYNDRPHYNLADIYAHKQYLCPDQSDVELVDKLLNRADLTETENDVLRSYYGVGRYVQPTRDIANRYDRTVQMVNNYRRSAEAKLRGTSL